MRVGLEVHHGLVGRLLRATSDTRSKVAHLRPYGSRMLPDRRPCRAPGSLGP